MPKEAPHVKQIDVQPRFATDHGRYVMWTEQSVATASIANLLRACPDGCLNNVLVATITFLRLRHGPCARVELGADARHIFDIEDGDGSTHTLNALEPAPPPKPRMLLDRAQPAPVTDRVRVKDWFAEMLESVIEGTTDREFFARKLRTAVDTPDTPNDSSESLSESGDADSDDSIIEPPVDHPPVPPPVDPPAPVETAVDRALREYGLTERGKWLVGPDGNRLGSVQLMPHYRVPSLRVECMAHHCKRTVPARFDGHDGYYRQWASAVRWLMTPCGSEEHFALLTAAI